ncbi:Yos1-like-domain-containing protein [Podospora didyma]|uniref:Yos1-like-domain-containing protein n=1 Tax=Podospora didyma TaxID=330526 RepID=A0AAE0P7H4_9PEZI|nr:Yos1-like-domain-containing protein [Podospora didyma]
MWLSFKLGLSPRSLLARPRRVELREPETKTQGRRRRRTAILAKMYLFGNLIYVSCLLINAVAILSEDRFLARINLSPNSIDPSFGQNADAGVKAKIVTLIASVRTLMRIPLIVINTLIIIYELVLG